MLLSQEGSDYKETVMDREKIKGLVGRRFW